MKVKVKVKNVSVTRLDKFERSTVVIVIDSSLSDTALLH